jgi:hypothetical protein
MGHPERLFDCDEQFLTPFFNKTIVCDRFLNILGYMHFSNNYSATDTIVTPNLTDYGN